MLGSALPDVVSLDRAGKEQATAEAGSLLVEAEAVGDRGRLATAGHAQLGKDVGDVHAGGLWGDEQRLADLAVRPPRCHQPKDLGLPASQAE
jgi:hypothetical protein